MKVILQDNNNFIIRFDVGEEVMENLIKFMTEQKVTACAFSGIGAVNGLELAYFNPHIKEYRKKAFFDDYEIVSFNGNGSMLNGQPTLHAHGIFSTNDFTTSVGGHVNHMAVSANCEIFLTKFNGEMKRELNSNLNLNTLI